MEEQLRAFASEVHKLGRSHEYVTGVSGTTNRENILLQLHKEASLMLQCQNDKEKLALCVQNIRGQLNISQATNTIGSKDSESLEKRLNEIEKEL